MRRQHLRGCLCALREFKCSTSHIVQRNLQRDSDLGDGEYDATDAAVRIYGLAALGGADSDYFVEDPNAPLSFEYAQGNGTARLTGACLLSGKHGPVV